MEPNKTVYFDQPGEQNTEAVLKLVAQKAKELGIKTIVLASSSGTTALKALAICQGLILIAVGGNQSQSDPDKIKEFKEKGGKVLYAYEDVSYDYPTRAQSKFRQMAGEGGKVAIEVVVVATLAGLIKIGEKVIGIGGTYPGADAALIIEATTQFLESKVQQIICCPKR